MVLLTATEIGPLRAAHEFRIGVAGSESNVAIGLCRLGIPTTFVSRVGADEFGERVVVALRGEGVDTSGVIRDATVPTSLMVKERRTASVSRILYYRNAGPGARLSPEDVDDEWIRSSSLIHLSGITPALSASAMATIDHVMDVARASSVPISFACNYRAALWPPETAAQHLRRLVAKSDIVFASHLEAALLVEEADPVEQATSLAKLGPTSVLVTLGADGAAAFLDGTGFRQPAYPAVVVDSVGAGDAFTAGFLASWLAGAPPADSLRVAAKCGAIAVSVPGDWEGFPTRSDLSMIDLPPGETVR